MRHWNMLVSESTSRPVFALTVCIPGLGIRTAKSEGALADSDCKYIGDASFEASWSISCGESQSDFILVVARMLKVTIQARLFLFYLFGLSALPVSNAVYDPNSKQNVAVYWVRDLGRVLIPPFLL